MPVDLGTGHVVLLRICGSSLELCAAGWAFRVRDDVVLVYIPQHGACYGYICGRQGISIAGNPDGRLCDDGPSRRRLVLGGWDNDPSDCEEADLVATERRGP